ncbi:MAG: tetratricopeptide repeat protein [Chthoniobacterales bacterium]
MIRRSLIFFAILSRAFAGEAENAVAQGRSARADGVPQAAIHDLKAVASRDDDTKVLVELARCLIESDREAEAILWLDKSTQHNQPDIIFWRAQAFAQKGDYEKALADYTRAAGKNFSQRDAADFGRARMLEALGRSKEALDAYWKISQSSAWRNAANLASAELLIKNGRRSDAEHVLNDFKAGSPEEKSFRNYLQGRLALEDDHVNLAKQIYDDFSPKNNELAAGAVIGKADAYGREKNIEKAEALLESFISENPDNPLLGAVFAKLDQIRAIEKGPSNSALKSWENDDDHALRSEYATFYLARSDDREERTDRAIRNYTQFIKDNPTHPLRTEAAIRLVRLLLSTRQVAAAASALPSDDSTTDRAARARLRFLRGVIQYESNDFPGAAKTFVGAANLDSALAEAALANAALSAVAGGSETQAAEMLNALRKENPLVARRIELAQAFESARADNPDSAEQLAWIANRGGAIGERARLALAERRWLDGDRAAAQSEFIRVANSKAAGREDQKDYFAVYLADDGSQRAVEAVTEAAQAFIAANPDSPRESDVRMKWGEVLMRSGDFRGARQQFEEAARNAADPATKQGAWFLAARAAIASMNPAELDAAIQLLEDVAQAKTEPLATQARIEQAMLQSALGHPKDAIAILDSLAASKYPRLRIIARLKKGETLLAMGATDKSQIDRAIGEWLAVAADPDVLPAERNEALTRAGAASAQKGDLDAALASYYEVLTAPRDRQPEYFWYYKAGFDAAQLLDAGKRYKEEAAIYEKMAGAPGPRADEFKDRLKRLRLENFIWKN